MVANIDKRTKNTLMLSLGGNLGNVIDTFEKAISIIQNEIGEVVLKSSLYKTEAWGNEQQPDFLNQVIQVVTEKEPKQCLKLILDIEIRLGRVRNEVKWSERIIDIDILLYNNDKIEEPNLKIPHPYLHKRNFILTPLAEICPDYIHPVLLKSVAVLEEMNDDELKVIKI